MQLFRASLIGLLPYLTDVFGELGTCMSPWGQESPLINRSPYFPCNHHTQMSRYIEFQLPSTHSLPTSAYLSLPGKDKKLTFPDSTTSRGDHVTHFGMNHKLKCLEVLRKNICKGKSSRGEICFLFALPPSLLWMLVHSCILGWENHLGAPRRRLRQQQDAPRPGH